MATFKRTDDMMVRCPYFPSHKVSKSKYHEHVIRCSQKPDAPQLEMCPFNCKHRIPKQELQKHLEQCEDRKQFVRPVEEVRYAFASANTTKEGSAANIVDLDETWEEDAGPFQGKLYGSHGQETRGVRSKGVSFSKRRKPKNRPLASSDFSIMEEKEEADEDPEVATEGSSRIRLPHIPAGIHSTSSTAAEIFRPSTTNDSTILDEMPSLYDERGFRKIPGDWDF